MDLLQRQAAPKCFCNFVPLVGRCHGMKASWERGRPARTRLGRVVAIGFTGLVGSPADWRRGSAFTRMRAGRPRSQGETHGWPSADPNFAKGSLDRYFSPFLEIFSPFPTFGGSLLSLLQPLSGPSWSFVPLRG